MHHTSVLSLIRQDSIVKSKKRYYPQASLEECKYEIKKYKMDNLINDHLQKRSPDESHDESDNDYNNETESCNEIDNDESDK